MSLLLMPSGRVGNEAVAGRIREKLGGDGSFGSEHGTPGRWILHGVYTGRAGGVLGFRQVEACPAMKHPSFPTAPAFATRLLQCLRRP